MLSEEEYRQLAFLARLDPDDASLRKAHKEFNTILEYVDSIQELELDTRGLSQKQELSARHYSPLREDIARKGELSHQAVSDFAPQWEAGYFTVPGVIKPEEH